MNSDLEQLVNHTVAKAVEAAVAEMRGLLMSGWNGPPEYLTEKQAAHFTGYSWRALEKMRLLGEAPKHYRVGRSIRYKVSDLRAWVEKDGPKHDAKAPPGRPLGSIVSKNSGGRIPLQGLTKDGAQ